jgi:WD40 repeat protein
VKVEDAIAGGTFSEIDAIGKGRFLMSTFSPDGVSFVAVTLRGIHVFDAKTWEESTLIPLDAGERVRSVVFSPDGSLFAAGDEIGNVTLWYGFLGESKQPQRV